MNKKYEITFNLTEIKFLEREDIIFLSIKIIIMFRLRDILFIYYFFASYTQK